MAEQQPASLFVFGKPVVGTPIASVDVRDNLDALAVLFRTNDEEFPLIKRDGMPRFNTSDVNNIRLQIWFDGAFRTIFQKIQLGKPAPAKIETTFDPAPAGNTWTIDHNLGSRPMVQVYDLVGNLLQKVTQAPPPRDQIVMSRTPPPVLTTLPAGPTILATWIATFAGAVDELVLTVDEPITGAPTMTFDAAIGGTPIGAPVVIGAPVGLGIRLGSGTPGGSNVFAVGQAVDVIVTVPAVPTGGFVMAYLDVERRLQTGQYLAAHATQNRVVITHPAPTAGFALLIG